MKGSSRPIPIHSLSTLVAEGYKCRSSRTVEFVCAIHRNSFEGADGGSDSENDETESVTGSKGITRPGVWSPFSLRKKV